MCFVYKTRVNMDASISTEHRPTQRSQLGLDELGRVLQGFGGTSDELVNTAGSGVLVSL